MSVQHSLKQSETDLFELQEAQSISRKLSTAITILDGTIGILNGLAVHAESMNTKMNVERLIQDEFQEEIENIRSEMRSNISNARSLLQISDRLFTTVLVPILELKCYTDE